MQIGRLRQAPHAGGLIPTRPGAPAGRHSSDSSHSARRRNWHPRLFGPVACALSTPGRKSGWGWGAALRSELRPAGPQRSWAGLRSPRSEATPGRSLRTQGGLF